MKKNIDKYQRGGVISSTDPNVNLATNQQGVISPEDQSFLDSVFNSASNTNNDISPQDSVFLQQAFGDSNQSQDPISQVGPIGTPDVVDPFNNFMDSAKESLDQPSTFHGKPIDANNQDYEQHLKYIQQAMDAGINIPDNTDIFSIKIEDAGIGYAGSNTGYLGNNFFDKDKYAGGPADSNLKRIILPNGQDYIFAPSGHTTGADKMYDLAVNAKESLTLGLTQGLEFTNQLLWKFSGLDAAMQLAGKDPAKEGYVNRTQGLFFAPFSNSLRKEIDAEKVKITPDEAYTENERLLNEKIASGDVESLWTEPMYWKKVLSEKSFHENFLPGLESVGEFMVPVMGAGKLKAGTKALELAMDAGLVGKASWIGKYAKTAGAISDEFLVAAYSGSSESHLEGMTNGGDIAVQKYNQLLGEDNQKYAINTLDELYAAPESEAKKQALETFDKAYSDIFTANQVPLIISNFLPAHVLMAGKSGIKMFGRAATEFAVKYPVTSALVGFTLQSGNEFIEEGYQSGVQNYETDKLLNGLYPLDNNAWDDIKGSWNRFTKDIGHDENTTTSALLGLVLGGGMGMFSEGAAALKQIKNNKETRELLQAHPVGQLGNIRGLFKDGQVDIAELAKKVNAVNSLVVNERFMEEAQKMNNQELMDYAYKQSVSGIIYEAMEKGIDESTVKTHLRGVLDKYTPKDKTFTDANGNIVKPSEFLDQRQKQFDEVIRNYEITNKIATEYSIEGKTKQSLFEAIIGYTSFKKIDEKFRSELKTLETETKAHNELLKQRQQEVKDAQAKGKDTFTPNVEDAISSYVDDYFENKKLNRDTRNKLVKKINETTGITNFYSKLINKLTDSTVSKDQRSLEKRNKIKNLIDRKIRESVERKGDPVNPVPPEDLPEVIAREVKAQDPSSNLEDTKREVTRQLDPALKAKEEALAVELWQDSERDGISYNELLNPTGKNISDQELDVRKNLLAKVLAKQRKDASKVDPEYRYDGRGLLKDVETKGAKDIATNGSPDVLNRIADRFLELKGMSPGARGTFTNFLAAPAEARLQDEIYLQAARDIYAQDLNTPEVPTGKTSTGEEDYGPILGEPTIPILTPGFTESVEETIPGNEQEDEVQKQKEEDAHEDLNRGLIEGELPQGSDVQGYEEISATERARRNKNMITVAHKQGLSPVEREKAPLRYTRTVDQWELGIGLIHSGELTPGTIIHLEVDPEVGSNKFGNPSWEALNVQAVTYVNGERVVIGQLQPYRQNYLNPVTNNVVQGSATPELEEIRKGIHKQWLAEKSSNSVIKTGYETTIKEIYKGNIDQKTARKGQAEYDLPSTQEALSGSGISINDVEIGMVTGSKINPVPFSTNNVRFKLDPNANTQDPLTGTGFIAVLIKSHKVFKDKSPHYETFRLYTRRVDDVKGYKEKIIELINSNSKSLVKDLVNFTVKNAQDETVSGIQWDYTGEHPLTLNGITIPAYTSYKKIGNQIVQGGEDLYRALGLGNKPVNVDSEWIDKYTPNNNKVTHPVFGDPNDGNRIDLKELVFKHLTKSGIIAESLNTYKWNGNMYKSLFHSGGFSVEPFAKPTVPIEGGTIRDVNSPEDFQDEEDDDEPTIRTNRRYKIEDQLTMPPDIVWENQKESEKWFKERLAEIGYTVSDDALKKLHNLLGLKESAKVWGVAQNAAVTLASLRPEGTTRHEAFHIVFNLFLTKPQRDAAFREAFYKFRPELEEKLGREVTREEFENELKKNLFGSPKLKVQNLSKEQVNYILKSADILSSQKAIDWFKKRDKAQWKDDLFYTKLSSELGISKDQVEILRSLELSNPYNREELLSNLLENYGFKVQVNTARDSFVFKEAYFDNNEDFILGTDDLVRDYDNRKLSDESRNYFFTSKDGNFYSREDNKFFKDNKRIDENLWRAEQKKVEREMQAKINSLTKGKPTQVYSYMTSPGGTNYRELRFTTPEIEPSIKGHALFATKNDIGWARVDEKAVDQNVSNELDDVIYDDLGRPTRLIERQVTTGGTPTKTRRILEIQSDLFQKGRDKSNLTNKEASPEDWIIEEDFGFFNVVDGKTGQPINSFNNKEKAQEFLNQYKGDNKNQFLQLLNKDNNWVTFFVKSLIQDSIKNGYEKVLFPSGDTASKVEGHGTIEEFKLNKIQEINKTKQYIKDAEHNIVVLKSKDGNYITLQQILDQIGTYRAKSEGIKINDHEYIHYDSDTNVITIKDHTYNKSKVISESKLQELDITDRLVAIQEENIRSFNNAISQYENELKQIEGPEGLAAFKPINFFYEDTVKNILNKITSVKEVIDEYGNKWFEVDLNKQVEEKVNPVRLKATGAEEFYNEQGVLALLEEMMADEFQYLKETNGLFSEGFKEKYPKLAKFLQDLYNFLFKNYNILQQYFSDTRSLDQLYRQIDNNSLGKNFLGQRRQSFTEVLNQNVARRVQENSTGANYKITSIPMARISQRISAINRDIINDIMLNDPMFRDSAGNILSLYDYISKTSTGKPINTAKESIVLLKNVYSKVKDKLDERIAVFENDLQKAKDRNRPKNIPYYENSIKKLQTMRDLISLDFFDDSKALFGTEEFDFTKRLISELRHSQGIVFKGKVLISHEQLQKKREELEKEASEGFDNSQNSESKGEENGGQITQDEWDTYESWQVDVLAENSYEKLSPKLKAEISTIPLMEDVKDPKTGVVVRVPQVDDLGFTIYTNAVKVFDLLVDTISSSANINIMMGKINKLRNKHEIIDHIMGKIETYDGNRVESLKKDLFLSIGNKYKVKHLVNLSATMRGTTGSYESVRVFESARAAIEENIRATFKSNFDQINWDLIKDAPKDRIGKAGKFEGYTYEEFKDLLEVEDPVDRNKHLPDILAAFGFQVTDSIRDYISNNVSQKNDEIYAHIQYMFNRMKEEIPVNPTNFMNDSGKGGSTERIKAIAKILRYADLNVDMKTFLNVKNKLVSGHVQAGFILKLFNRLKEDIIDNEDIESKEHALDNFNKENTDVFFRKSAILSWLNQGKNIDLTVAYMDGRKRNNVQEGEEITDMGEAIMHINKFEFWIGGMVTEGQKNTKFDYDWNGGTNGKFKNSWYNIAVFDSPKTYFTKLPVFEKIEDVFTYGLQHVYEQERDRIKTLTDNFNADPNYTTGNKELDENGRKFQFFPELNSTMPMSWELAKPTIERAMASHYDNYINILEGHGLVKRHENKDPNTGVITKSIIPTSKMTAANIKGKTFEESLKLFFYNDTLMTTQTISLLSGDPASYSKNKLNDLTSTAYQKRNKQLHANGNYGAFENPTYKAIYLKDIEVESKENFLRDITGLMESQGFKGNALKIIVDGFRKHVDPKTGKVSYPHNTTDAQGYITLDRWKDVLTAFNEWTDKHEAMYERLKDGNPTDEDLFLVSQPLKPHYFGFQKLKDSSGNKDFKTPLQHKYSAVVIHPMLTKSNPSLKKLADKMKFHGVDEAIFQSGVKVGLTNLMSVEDFVDGDFHETVSKINVVENQYYKQQQKVPAHYLGTVSNLLGVQVRKILPANMNLNIVYATSKSHPELAALNATLIGEYKDNLYGRDLLRLIDKLQSDNIEKDLSKLVARVMDVPAKDSKGNPISDVERERIRRDNVRNILLDAINDKDLNSNHEDAIEVGADGNFKLPLSFPTIARKTEEIFNSLFKKVSKQTHNGGSFVNMSSYGFDDDLSIKIDPVTKEFYVEVALPANSKLLGKNIKTGEIEKIQEGIVYRIPTEEKYSMFPIRVVKWLDPSVGGVIAMPREITSIAGLDFDIDKVYAMFYNHDYDDKTGLISVPRSPATREGRENLLLDAYRTILQNANSAKDALRPQSVQELKDIRKDLGRVSVKERPIHIPQSQVKFLVRNQAGKNLIGIVANHNSFHSLANNAGVKLNSSLLDSILVGSLAQYKGIVTGSLDGTDVLTTKSVPPIQISRNFAMLLSAAVDNAKDPILDDLNINIFTMPVLGLLLHMGIDMNAAINRINEADFLAASKAFELDGVSEALAVSEDIKTLHNAAKSLSRVISALRVDSGTGPTFHDVDKKINDINKVFEDTTAIDTGNLFPEISNVDGKFVILEDGLNKLVPESIKSYIRVFLQEANFAKIDYPYFNQEFEDVKKYLSNFKPAWSTMSANNRRLADTEHQAILHYNLFNLRGKSPQDFLIEFPAEFIKFVANYNASDPTGAYGDLFKPFSVDEKTGELGLLDKNSLDKQAQQDIRDKWESALFDESGTEEAIEIKKMAEDLITYGFMLDGYSFTKRSYMHLVPVNFFAGEGKEGFKKFNMSEGMNLNHIGLFTALNNPFAFIPRFYDGDFTHTNPKHLKDSLLWKTENNVDYYLPAYAKQEYINNEPTWVIYLNDDFVNSNYNKNKYLQSPKYTQMTWKDTRFTGRVFKVNDFGTLSDPTRNTADIPQPVKADEKTAADKDLENIAENISNKEYTPENIQSLRSNEIFVFGSNADGIHGKGAALLAKNKFGAKQGQSEGLQGQSYAVITKKDWRVEKSSTLNEIGKGLQTMLLFAKSHPENKFLVTKLGSSLAGYSIEEIKGLFEKLKNIIPDNVILPKEYEVRNSGTTEGMLKDTFTEDEVKDALDKLDDSITKDLEDC